jgi:hypothetical protein
MKLPGFRDRSTTTVDPVTGDATVRAADGTRTTTVHDTGGHPLNAATGTHGSSHPTSTAAPAGAVTAKELQRELHDAYERGKRDQRAASKNNPILTILVVLLAILGVTLAVLAAMNGSFREGGARFDRMLGGLGGEAREVGVQAQDAAGEAAQDAGAALQERGAEAEAAAEGRR